MTRPVECLPANAARFARHCIETMTLMEVAQLGLRGVDVAACEQWQISAEQWQDAILAAVQSLGRRSPQTPEYSPGQDVRP